MVYSTASVNTLFNPKQPIVAFCRMTLCLAWAWVRYTPHWRHMKTRPHTEDTNPVVSEADIQVRPPVSGTVREHRTIDVYRLRHSIRARDPRAPRILSRTSGLFVFLLPTFRSSFFRFSSTMMVGLQVVNDTIVAVGKPFTAYSPHEHHVRDAMFIITCFFPMLGAGLILLARDGWWIRRARLSAQTVLAAWLISITAFGIVIYLQHGMTTRGTFVLAIMHEQIELLLDCVLLGCGARRSFATTWIFGVVMLTAVLALPSMSSVFMFAAIIGGGNDAFMVLLFWYGKQYWFAVAALGHLISAIMVFTEVIGNIGVVTYNVMIFLSIAFHVGATVFGVMELDQSGKQNNDEESAHSLHDFISAHHTHHAAEGGMPNPLAAVSITNTKIITLAILGLLGSTGVTLFLAFVLPNIVDEVAQAIVFVVVGVVVAGVVSFSKWFY